MTTNNQHKRIYSDSPHQETPAQKASFVYEQLKQARDTGEVECYCGRRFEWISLFRCLYCREFYCAKCAEEHFGKTRLEWLEEEGMRDLNNALENRLGAKC